MLTSVCPGLWRWTGMHPDWVPEEDALDASYRTVASHALETPEALVLVDPLAPPPGTEAGTEFWEELDDLIGAQGRPLVVVLTIHWHERSAAELFARYDADPGVTIRADAASIPRLAFAGARPFAPDAPLPDGLHVLPTARPGEVVAWAPALRTLLAGDVILGAGGGLRLCPAAWMEAHGGLAVLAESLRPLLELPFDRVLTAHGAPVLEHGRAALSAALAAVPRP